MHHLIDLLAFFRFQYFYPKTGVTGPYVFGAGLLTYLCSKEIYVMEHEYYSGLSILLMVVYATKKFGPGLAAYLDKEVDVSFSSSLLSDIEFTKLFLNFRKLKRSGTKAEFPKKRHSLMPSPTRRRNNGALRVN